MVKASNSGIRFSATHWAGGWPRERECQDENVEAAGGCVPDNNLAGMVCLGRGRCCRDIGPVHRLRHVCREQGYGDQAETADGDD